MFKQTVATLALFAALTTTASAQRRIDDPPAPGGSADLITTSGQILASGWVRFTIENRGTTTAKACQTQVVFMAGTVLGGVQIKSAALDPGQSKVVLYLLPDKAQLAHLSGKRVTVSIKVDYCNAVDEYFEDNNEMELAW